jgi:hypothetical protein
MDITKRYSDWVWSKLREHRSEAPRIFFDYSVDESDVPVGQIHWTPEGIVRGLAVSKVDFNNPTHFSRYYMGIKENTVRWANSLDALSETISSYAAEGELLRNI